MSHSGKYFLLFKSQSFMGFNSRMTHGYDAIMSMNTKSESYVVLEMWEMIIMFP